MTRFFDIVFSFTAIVFLTPLLIPIIILLKLTGEHDIFYAQDRVGKDKKVFKVLKFATMLRDSPNMSGGLITSNNDPRMLPMGNFLRKTKINELPQLINIFLGQMSVVGYRPFAVKHYALYAEQVQNTISSIAPGLTGIGSVVFHDEENILHHVNDRDYFHDRVITPYKGKLESWYVENRSIGNYFKLIFLTALVLVKPGISVWDYFPASLPPLPDELKSYIK